MADEQTTQENGAQAATEQTATPQAGTVESPGGDNDEQVSLEEARRLRSEAKNLRQRLKTAEEERDRLKSASESDLERREREHNEVRAERDRLAGTVSTLRVELAARELGVVDPEAAAALLDLDALDDPTDPKAIKRALRELVKEKPYLAPPGGNGFDGGSGKGRGSAVTDMNQLIRTAAGRA